MQQTMTPFESNTHVIPFAFAGKAQFSAMREPYTIHFRVYKRRSTGRCRHVYLVYVKRDWTDRSWNYAGYVKEGQWYPNTPLTEINTSFRWLNKVLHRQQDPRASFYHHDICGRCGRSLYRKKSVMSGFGPVCWKKLQHNQEVTI